MTKKIIALVLALVITGAIVGAYYYPHLAQNVGSATGTTFNTAKFAGVVISLANPGANGTSTSILNTDSFDRYVTSWKVACNGVGTSQTAYTGAGLSSLKVSVGTTTSAAPATFLSFAAIASAQNLSTSTTVLEVSSSTLQSATSSLAARWPSNTYLTFSFNATNTAACTVGADYVGS